MRKVRMGPLALRIDDDQPTFWDRVEAGGWEPGTLAVLDRLVGPGTTFLDLGSWVGALSLYAAGQGARVFAVEADPAAVSQLRRNLAANPDLAARVTVLPRAVAAEVGPVRLGACRKPGDSMSSVLLAGDGPASWLVDAITPDDLVAAIGPTDELFVKLDIEGGEYTLLPALGPLLAQTSALLAAFHPDMATASGVADLTPLQRRALAPLAGWSAERIDEPGECLAAGEQPVGFVRGEWLFRPERDAGRN